MPNSLIINSNVVINANLDHYGRVATFTSSVNVGNTAITPTSITVQSLVVGSISTSGAGGSSTGFAITGNGSFTGSLSAGSFSTVGTFSAGNTVFNGTVTLGNITLQNGNIGIGNTAINGAGMTIDYLTSRNNITAQTIDVVGINACVNYRDRSNNSINWVSYSNSGAYRLYVNGADKLIVDTTGNLTTPANIYAQQINLTTGGTPVVTDSAGNGGLRIVNGGVNNTGYIEFRGSNTAAPRLGYIGFGPSGGGAISISGEGSSYFNFIGNEPVINGNGLWHAGNFTPSNYATLSGLNSTNANFANYLPLSGGVVTGDLVVYRAASPGTGVLYLNSAKTAYHFWDGSNHNFQGGGALYFNGNRVFSRDAYNPLINARLSYIGPLSAVWLNRSYGIPYYGAVCVGQGGNTDPNGGWYISWHLYSYMQVQNSDGGWYTISQ